jgi:hypothetical protein
MQYLMTIYNEEQKWAEMSSAEEQAIFKAYLEFGKTHGASLRGGNALQPTSTATTVRVRSGECLTTDGPFAETKEQLGGYYLVEAANLDEAIAIAAKIPGAGYGSVEVRPIMTFAAAQGGN